MKRAAFFQATRLALAVAVLAGSALDANADAVTDWNVKAGELIAEAKLGTPPAIRVVAITQTAVYGAVNAITQRFPASGPQPARTDGASVEAAVAAANRATLAKLLPSQQASIDAAYNAALAMLPDGNAKSAGIAVGESAAALAIALRAADASVPAEAYRPHTTPGAYVPTTATAVPQWSQRKPWLMSNAAEFRPAPPPALTSAAWARDYNEVKELGGRTSTRRTAEQTEIARFWEFSLPSIYLGVVRSVADTPGRDMTRNARLLATVAQAMDDAMIGVFDAKYHYNFWRPATAIRNGDIDGHDATQRDASWTSLSDAPMHPEYPSGHAILAGAVGAVLQAEIGDNRMPVLTTTSPTANGAARRWTSVNDFVQEVGNARIYSGIHYRMSTDAGAVMGRRIGELAAAKHLQLAH